jgi:hypothetical protein
MADRVWATADWSELGRIIASALLLEGHVNDSGCGIIGGSQVLHSTLAFFAEHLGASAAERYPRPAVDERRMALLEKLVTRPQGERTSVCLPWAVLELLGPSPPLVRVRLQGARRLKSVQHLRVW